MGVQNPNQRPTPKAAPKPAPRAPQARPLAPAFRPISNPVKALATIPKKSPQQKLARALKPIGNRPAEVVKPFANPVQSLAQLHPASAMVAEKHLIEAHQRSSEVAKNLYNTAFDPKETLSHRLSAARILREHYAFPVSQSDYVAAVQPKSAKTDVHHSLLHNILHGVESGAVSVANVPLGLANEAYQVHDQRTRGGTASSVSGAVDQLKALGHEAYRAHDQATQEGVGGVGYVAAVPAAVKALAEHPGKVLGASGRSLPGFAEGIVAGPVKALMDPAGAVRGITADTKAFEQNPKKYVEQQGIIGPALNVGAVGAGVGRLAGLGAEEGAFGARAAEVMAKRPDLRFAQGPMGVVRQERSKNFFKAAGQKVIDTKRAKADVGRTGPVKAGEGEVTPLLHENVGGKNVHITSTVNKKIGKSAAFQQQVAHNRYQQELIRQKHLFQSEMPKALTHDQWHSALRVAVERGIRTPAQAKAYLPKLIEQIKAIRAVNPRHNLADELPHLQKLVDHPEVFNKTLGDYANQLRELGKTRAEANPRLKGADAEVRRVSAQAHMLGEDLRRPGEKKAAFVERITRAATGATGPIYHHAYEPLRGQKPKPFSGMYAAENPRNYLDKSSKVASFRLRANARVHDLTEADLVKAPNGGPGTGIPKDAVLASLRERGYDAARFTTPEGDRSIVLLNPKAALPPDTKGAGLADPGYFPHNEWHKVKFSDFTLGRLLHGAPAKGKETNYTLMHQGAGVHDPAALEQAFANQLKQAHGVNAAARIANNFRVRSYEQAGKVHQIPDKGLTFAQVQRVQQLPGYEKLMPWNPKVFYKSLRDKSTESDVRPGADPLSAFHSATDGVAKSGWHLIPEAVYKEMQQGYKGNSGAQRFFSHAKSLQSTAILGILHPSWPAFRIFHNLFASAVGGVNPTKAFEIGRKLTPEQADMLNQIAVSNPLRYEDKPARFGSTIAPKTFGDKVRTAYNSQSPTARAIRGVLTSPKTIAKPAFRIEARQMAHFQQSAAFQKLDRDAKAMVKQDVTGLVDTVNKAHDKLLKDPKYQEEIARHVEKIFGDFTHYPGVHKFFSQNLMFYGYLRYATRFVLKTLPTEHPITTSILYQLEKQNEENTRKVLKLRPNEPLPPGAASQVFWRNASGTLQHINLHRLNPFGALPIENATNPAKTAVSSLPFVPQMFLENVFNYDLTRGAPWRVKGKSVQTGPTNFDQVKLADRGRILGADLLNNLAPVRVLEGAQDKGLPMGNDSLPWSKRPVVRAKLDAAVYDQLAHQRNRGLLDALIKTEAPFIPSPSTEDLSVLKGRAFQKETALQKAQDKLQLVQTPGFGKAVVPAARQVAIQKAIDKVNKAVQDGGLTKAAGAQIVKNLQKMKG